MAEISVPDWGAPQGNTFASKYKPEYCNLVIEILKQGRGLAAFASACNISKKTAEKWIEVYPDFTEAYEIGMAHCERFYENVGLAGMTGQIRNFNPRTLEFFMGNKFGMTSKTHVEHTAKDGEGMSVVQVYLPSNDRDDPPSIESSNAEA